MNYVSLIFFILDIFLFFFSTIFYIFLILVIKQSLHYCFGSSIETKMFFTSVALKTEVQPLRLTIRDCFAENSFSSGRRLYLVAIN